MAYVYRHIRKDINKVFYIGIGSDENYKRSISKHRRNDYWKNIVSKTEYEVEIIFDDLSWEQACEKEKEFILIYGRKNLGKGTLCNMTNGGDGVIGHIFSDESKRKMSEKLKGNSWNKGKKHSQEVNKKKGLHWVGRKHTEEERRKISERNKKSKLVIDTRTGTIYPSIKYLSEFIGVKHSTLKSQLNGTNKNNTKYKLL